MTTEQVGVIKCGNDLPQDKIVKSYARNLSTDRDPMYFDDQVVDLMKEFAWDVSRIEEVVAQLDSIQYTSSRYSYSQIEDQLSRFEMPNVPYFGWNKNFKAAKDTVSQDLAKYRLRSIRYRENADVMDNLPKKDTHAGASYLVTGKRKKGEYEEDIFFELLKREKDAKLNGTFGMPLMIGSRTQASMPYDDDGNFTASFKTKSRLVSMVDVYTILSEVRFARPVQSALNRVDWYAGGKNDDAINVILNRARSSHDFWLSIDYSGFDQSISSWLIREAFDVVRSMFVDDSEFDDTLFKVLVNDFCRKHFIDGEGKLRYSEKGVPSGSMFTQIIDSIVNRLMIITYLNSQNIISYDMLIMGDDNIIFTRQFLDRNDLEGYLNANFGVQVHGDKSSQGGRFQDPEFLSRYWSRGGAYRNPNHLIAKMAYPERFRNYSSGKVFVELVLYSYILGYRQSMGELIDIRRFMLNYPNLENRIREVGTQGMSGFIQFNIDYLL